MLKPVGSIEHLISLMHARLRVRARSRSSASVGGASARLGSLDALIGSRVAAIPLDDPERGRKVFRVFLEVVLLSQFGRGVINDPKFYLIIDDVHRTMECDPETARLIAGAVEHLLRLE